MDFNEMRYANMLEAASYLARRTNIATTYEDIVNICANYGLSFNQMTNDEINELFRLTNQFIK